MKKLESLDAWIISNTIAREVYELTMHRPLERHFRLADQIRGAAISIPANIAEGYGLGTTAQLVRHTRISLGSTYELICHLEVARDLGLVEREAATKVGESLQRLIRVLIGLLNHFGARVPQR